MTWEPGLPANNTKLRLSPAIFQANNVALQSVVSSSNLNAGVAYLPDTAPIYMYTAAAPTGWTLVSSPGDCLLALAGGSSAYNVPGGTLVGTWTGPSYTLIATDLPNLAADATVRTGSSGLSNFMGSTSGGSSAVITLNVNVGGNQPHHHDWTSTRPMGAVGILCTKNP